MPSFGRNQIPAIVTAVGDAHRSLDQLTVIFEYGIAANGCTSVKNWHQRWKNLDIWSIGSANYKNALQAITLDFTEAGTHPSQLPNQSSLNQLRTNEGALHGIWQLRELVVDQLDAEDQQAVEESEHLRGPGVFFAFNTRRGAGEATQLWIDAMNRIRQHVQPMDCAPERLPNGLFADFTTTALGRISSSVLAAGTAAGIALVDGGIEQLFVGSRRACLRQMICDVAQTWDQSPNRLYVCRDRAT